MSILHIFLFVIFCIVSVDSQSTTTTAAASPTTKRAQTSVKCSNSSLYCTDEPLTITPTETSCTWQNWTDCSVTCGPNGVMTRECKLGDTVVKTTQSKCNYFCLNNGTITENGICLCSSDFTGTCCELQSEGDVKVSHTTAGKDVVFHCDIDYETTSQTVLQFEWFVGDEVVFNERHTGHSTRSSMQQSYWEGRMGSQIRCEVEIAENDVILGKKGSTSFFAGITVDAPDIIDVYENDDAVSFNLNPTVPFLCAGCQVQIPLTVTDRTGRYGKYVDVVVGGECGVTMTTDKPYGPFTVSVKARRDFFNDGDGTVYLDFLPIESSGKTKLWNGYKIPVVIPIKTYDRDRNSRKCSGTGDPHYTTFDGMYFHVYLPGEYIFYRHMFLPYEVQTRLTACGRVACNCGVAARAEDDVIIVDRCRRVTEQVVYYINGRRYSYPRSYGKLVIKVIVNGEMTPGFRIVKEDSGRAYKIYFPTGAYVEIQGTYYLNVYFSSGSDDYGWENIGLCGSFDSDSSNDLLHGPVGAPSKKHSPARRSSVPHDFATTWRVELGKNLFYGQLDKFEKENTTQVYCTCSPSGESSNKADASCDYGKDNGRPTNPGKGPGNCNSHRCDITDELILGSSGNSRRKRDIERRATTAVDDDLAFEYDEDFEPEIPSWPTESGITEQRAKNECLAKVTESGPGKACQSALNETEVEEYVEACTIDIQVLDDLSVAKSSADLLKAQCEEVVTKNTDFWEDSGTDGTFGPPTSIIGALCPSDCNDNGNCTDGMCDCFDGYGGTDCSVDLNKAPVLYRSGQSGLCDHNIDSCTYVSFFGDNFVEADDLTCHVTTIEITSSEFTMKDGVLELPGIFQTFEEVKCPIEESSRRRRDENSGSPVAPKGALISISNDGEKKSDQVLVIVYDANCDVCNGTEGFCYRRTDICIVGGDCYGLNDPKCKGSNVGLIVGVTVGSVATTAVVVTLIVVCFKKKGTKKVGVDNSQEELKETTKA
ncbi:von Willebrand factor D and EGF domain-containing protein-like [Glandiceps talaboti]